MGQKLVELVNGGEWTPTNRRNITAASDKTSTGLDAGTEEE